MKRKALLLVVLILVLVLLPAKDEDIWGSSYKKINSIAYLIDEYYFQDVDYDQMTYSSIRGLLRTLDPHSYFLDPDHFARLTEEHVGKYHGLGILIQKQEDRLVVISPIEGGPAYRLGILPGDVISHINGESTKLITGQGAVQKLRGPKGTQVNITIVREGSEKPLEMTVTREEIPLHSVPYAFMLQDDIGYIFIRNFSGTTTREFKEKMNSLAAQGMKKLILDFRLNGGGTLRQSIEISEQFLPKNAAIVSMRGRNKEFNQEFIAESDNEYEDIPLVLLISRSSASAPEIVSGAIKDNDRGLIVGENSFGKGLVQTVFPLSENSAVALTTARYFTPSGRSIQRDYTHIEDYMRSVQAPDEEREVRYTAKGRKVLGQGGITPDYEIKTSADDIIFYFIYKGAFFTYARKFVNSETPLSKQFIFPEKKESGIKTTGEKQIFGQNFKADSRVIQDFKRYLRESKIDYQTAEFETALAQIKKELERDIFSAVWGVEEGWWAYQRSDPVVHKAIEVFPKASSLIKKDDSE
ncbi:MAG: S41 family peptidase [Candidatus Aminicenantes bacterium]